MKKISIASLGGTISMTKSSNNSGIAPQLSAKDFIGALPDLSEIAQISTKSILSIPSSYITQSNLAQVIDWARNEVRNGANGIVITQGTDTMEETAFWLDLFWDSDIPLVVTGAMKNPEALGAEGNSNLVSSIRVAASNNSRARGVLVVMNDCIYEAKWVLKGDANLVNAFVSKEAGCGRVLESNCYYFAKPIPRVIFQLPPTFNKKVFFYQSSFDDDTDILSFVEDHYDGLVISALGAGHVSAKFSEYLSRLVKKMPVVIGSRTRFGKTASKTYGYVGSEIDLQKKGAIMSGWLESHKARVLLLCILNNKLPIEDFKRYLDSMSI